MPKKYLITSLTFIFLLYGIVFALNNFASAITSSTPQITPDAATLEKAKNGLLAGICSGHGGVNCSVLNSNASIVCNDGTIDTSLSTIYAVPQCQEIIKSIVTQQSDFMAESGCFPPSEMVCFNEQSYQNLYKILDASGLVNSELGKSELGQCRKDIATYETENKNYKQCLVNHNQPNFTPSGRVALPILKAAFCPLFYGTNSSYNQGIDLCLCDKGYFLHNGQCTEATKICQIKYGSRTIAKNGNCTISSTVSASPKPSILPTPAQTKNNYEQDIILNNQNQDINYQPEISNTNEMNTTPNSIVELNTVGPQSNKSFVRTIFGSIISGIKNMLKLF